MINIENMAIRTSLLNGNNISRDADFSKYIETVSEPWVIEWLLCSASTVAIWKARVPCERTNGETIYALVSITTPVSISWNGDVYIEVSQTYIDDWELANEDWTGIATIGVWTMPNKNALKLATITNWVVADKRNMIVKLWELNTFIQSLDERMWIAEGKIDEIIANDTIECLETTMIVWEKYTISDDLFIQESPSLDNCWTDLFVGDVEADREIHIQRIASWVSSNTLSLKIKSVWEPTTWLVIEVRKGVVVSVSDNRQYWYWGELLCSWSIPYTSITNEYQAFTVNLNWQFGWTKWDLLSIVVKQTWGIVNSTNYYSVARDTTQTWQAYSCVKVNWTTRTNTSYMPYCDSDWFLNKLFAKPWNNATTPVTVYSSWKIFWEYEFSSQVSWTLYFSWSWSCYRSTYTNLYILKNWTQVFYKQYNDAVTYDTSRSWTDSFSLEVSVGDAITIKSTHYQDTWTQSAYHYCTNVKAVYSNVPIILKPKTVEAVWSQATAVSFWMIWGVFKWGQFVKKWTSCTTWAITLWQAVWYLDLNFGGEILRIPYYN